MTATVFDSTKDALHDLLQQLREGKIQLPDFQRGWVWDDDHIRDVIASVARAFPIGAVMMLETGGEAKFQPRPVQGISFSEGGEVEPERLILDGQQRLTSLYQALMLGDVVETKERAAATAAVGTIAVGTTTLSTRLLMSAQQPQPLARVDTPSLPLLTVGRHYG